MLIFKDALLHFQNCFSLHKYAQVYSYKKYSHNTDKISLDQHPKS